MNQVHFCLLLLEDSASLGGANNADGVAVTADQLAAVFDHVNIYIEARYQNAILAKTDFSNPPTLAEVQELIDSESANLSDLYKDQSTFNDDISDMDTSGATNMRQMFSSADAFNQPIGAWDVSNVTIMWEVFGGASAFNQPIGAWDVSSVTNMEGMFISADAFNQPIGAWDVGNVTDMSFMFSSADAFNQPIGAWDVSNVTDMERMFREASSFNQDIGDWDVGNVITMRNMFNGASAFDQDIGDWDVANVTNMSGMFGLASAFDQDIGDWDISKLMDAADMFFGVRLTTGNYDSLLRGWARRARVNYTGEEAICAIVAPHDCFNGGDNKYTHATAREYWLSKGWTITDGDVASGVTEGTANADSGSAPGNSLNKSAETGAQILHGLAGADVLTGGSAADVIHGGADNDTISGGGGADEIHGAAGDDTLSGGLGADTFVFGYPNAGNDTISDFITGASGDVIDISLLIESYVAGSSTLSNFVTATTSGGTTTLTIDPNGDGTTTDQVTIILTNVSTTVEALVNGGNLKLE